MKIDEKILLEQYFPQALKSLQEIVKIPSYAQPPLANAPFGIGVGEVLDYALNLAHDLGFEVYQDRQNRYGYLDYGQGEELFVILCHLDVVPPGNLDQWTTPPFDPKIVDNHLVGRGVFDDKGPTIINLYALKYLLDQGFQPDYKIRLIFGLTEETTWASIRAYVQDYGSKNVVMGYTPDGNFPVVYAEKWVVDCDLHSGKKADFVIKGGTAYNVVADVVSYQGPKQSEIATYLNSHHLLTSYDADHNLIVQGKAAHGSLPYLGVNAITWLGMGMKEVGITHEVVDLLVKMHLDFSCQNLLSTPIKDETGVVVQNLGMIDVIDGYHVLKMNYRIPALAEVYQDFVNPFTVTLNKQGFEVKNLSVEDRVYVPCDSVLIKKIMKTYQEVTGDNKAQPLAIGGGTYAKAMPNVVAFGAEFDQEHSTMHAYNEAVKLSDLKLMLTIYTKSLAVLTKK